MNDGGRSRIGVTDTPEAAIVRNDILISVLRR